MALRTGNLIMDLFKRSDKWKNLSNEELKQLKLVMLDIVEKIVAVCDKYDLEYVLGYGSALGAVRHRGFIPWDDDVDVCMPRKDYNKFLKVAEKELGEEFFIRSISKGDYMAVPTCHVRKKGTYYVNYGDMVMLSSEPEEMMGIYVDIFPLENAPNNAFLRRVDGTINLSIQFIMSCITTKKTIKCLEKIGVILTAEEKKLLLPKIILGSFLEIVPLEVWCRILDKYASKNHNHNSKYVTSYTGYKNLEKSTYEREKIKGKKLFDFEGRKWNVPCDYDYYLKTIYNDYMKMPDKNHQKIHPVFELVFDTNKR